MARIRHVSSVILCLIVIFLSLGVNTPTSASASPIGVAVLVFHQITPGASNSVTMSPDNFAATLQMLKQKGYNFIDLKTLHSYLAGSTQLANKSLLITFDDGYQDVYKYAHPLLVKQQIPAVMFPIAMYYQESYPLPPHYTPHLSRDELKIMQESGWWGFGGHSFDGHRPILTVPGQTGPFYTSYAWMGRRQETQLEYTNRVDADIAIMCQTLNTLGLTALDFAPPSCAINSTLQAVLAKNGVRYIYVQGNRLNYPGSNTIYRLTATNPDQVLKDLDNLFATPGTVVPAPIEVIESNNNLPTQTDLKSFSSSVKQAIYNKQSFLRRSK
ncbi:MAG: polysaccharide deacetylase family protein [Methylocystaceae bacterium]